MLNGSPHWYAVHTKPREESRALQFLSLKGITTFLPRLLVHHRHGSRRWQAAEPLFPGYLFARFIPEPALITAVQWTPGVRQVLWNGTGPSPVPDEVVTYLQERVAERGVIVPDPKFVPGMHVRISRGPLEHLEGIIERHASRTQRIRVLLGLLHTEVSVEVNVDDLEEA